MAPDDVHPDDADIMRRFAARLIDLDEWTHAMHLRVGWLHVRLYDVDGAVERLRNCIMRLNETNGIVNGPDSGYHETITRAWAYLIDAAHASDDEPATSSAEFLDRHPELLETKILFKHYRRDRLLSLEARTGWVEPDLRPFGR